MPTPPYQSALIERVVENADELFRVAADGGCIPLATSRSRYAFFIEARRDLDRGQAGGKPGEDPAYDLRRFLINFQDARDHLALGIEFGGTFVPVGTPSGKPTSKHGCLHAADSLVDQMFEKDRTEQACDCELDLVDMTLGYRMQLDAVVREYLANPRDILGIACEAIKAFADDDVDDTGLCGLNDLRQSRAVPPVT
nr:hypothetical protein [Sphingomonas faeni]